VGIPLARIPIVKSVLRIALVPVAAVALVVVVAALRRDTLPETPGAVVEKFLDHLSEKRYEKAAALLGGPLRESATPAALEQWESEAVRGLGTTRRARGETEWISGSGAEATGVIEAGRRDRRLRFGLQRESGRWVLTRLDDFWQANAAPAESLRIREVGRRRAASHRRP
jgi:hypothetical protein